MVEKLILIFLYYAGMILAFNMVEKRHRGEKLEYPMVFTFCALSWIAVFLMSGETALNNITYFIREVWKRK